MKMGIQGTNRSLDVDNLTTIMYHKWIIRRQNENLWKFDCCKMSITYICLNTNMGEV